MRKIWILVANRAEAKIFENEGTKPAPKLVSEMEHPAARERNVDINTDRPGRTFERAGSGRHAMASNKDPLEHEAEVFAKEIADAVDKARQEGAFDELIVFSEPSFLGELNKRLSDPVKKLISESLDRNLPDMTEHKIKPHLERVFEAR